MKSKSSLKKYQKKRNFGKTPEPKRTTAKKSFGTKFVIQLHHASHKHYDFRLQVGRVLKSWAIPKGISTNPAIKRLAVQTKDHPLSYASFEGVIPEGNYGAGTVMIWDYGTYRNIKEKNGKIISMNQCLKNGHIEVCLHGKKLKGNYALIKTKLPAKNSWLLIKIKDKYAHTAIKNKTKSAKTERSMKEITGTIEK